MKSTISADHLAVLDRANTIINGKEGLRGRGEGKRMEGEKKLSTKNLY